MSPLVVEITLPLAQAESAAEIAAPGLPTAAYVMGGLVAVILGLLVFEMWKAGGAPIPFRTKPHPVTGVNNGKLGIWLFLGSEVMLFGALFSTYILLRVGAPPSTWPHGPEVQNVPLGTLNTLVLISSSITVVMAWASLKMKEFGRFAKFTGATVALAAVFMVIKAFEYGAKFHHEHFPATSTYYAIYFTLTGLHGLHVLGGILVFGYLLLTGPKVWREDPDQLTGRVECAGLYWHFVDLVWIFLFPTLYLL